MTNVPQDVGRARDDEQAECVVLAKTSRSSRGGRASGQTKVSAVLVTPEMCRAGADVLSYGEGSFHQDQMAREVYKAMELVRLHRTPRR